MARGETLDRAAAYGSVARSVLVRFLQSIEDSIRRSAESRAGRERSEPRENTDARASLERGIAGKLTAFTDGASRGNPGRAACAVVLFDEKNEELLRRTKPLGTATNNVAEYEGVILALDYARALGASELEIRLDSELVVRQLSGEYKVKNLALKELHDRAREKMRSFDGVTVTYIRREENALADGLVNAELDGRADGTSADPEEIRRR